MLTLKKPKTKIFFTADWHLGHKACLGFDNRPFTDIEHMERVIIKRFNSRVDPTDVIYFLGDLGRDFKKVVHKLNGNKILVPGNHDQIGMYAAYDMGFSAVTYSGSFKLGKNLVTYSHCPLRGVFREDVSEMLRSKPGENWHREFDHVDFSIENYGQWHLHGHCHSDPKSAKLGKQLDVGVPAHNYFPVSMSYIESWMAHGTK